MISKKRLNFSRGADKSMKFIHKPKRENLHWNQCGTLAAILLILSLCACAVPAGDHNAFSTPSAPYDGGNTGMGYEGTMNFDGSEFNNGNPWTKDAQLQTLPVFENLAYTGDDIPVYLGKEELYIMAEAAATAMGLKILDFTYETVSPGCLPGEGSSLTGDEIYSLNAVTDTARINVEGDGHVSVWFDEPLYLPEGFNFTSENTTREEAVRVLGYLSEEFSGFTHFVQPERATWVTYYFNGEQHRYYQTYDGAGDLTEKILSYNFNSVFFSPSDQGLWSIESYNFLKSTEKVDNYPIITWKQARDLLLDGQYITSVSEEEMMMSGAITEDRIANVELIYRVHDSGEYFLPYYRFAVKIDRADNMSEGISNYGYFYVPAVSGEYLTDLPVWDGMINR